MKKPIPTHQEVRAALEEIAAANGMDINTPEGERDFMAQFHRECEARKRAQHTGIVVDLSDFEAMWICREVEHSPTCPVPEGVVIAYIGEDGSEWTDEELTIPFTPPDCTCGFWDKLEALREKVRVARTVGDRRAQS